LLNLARALQGVGAAAMFAVSLALIAVDFKRGRERGMAMGMYGATIGLAVAIGPLVGGALTDSLGWRWIFYLNVPIGLAALAVTFRRLHESRDPRATRIDWAGVVTFSSALFALVFALLRGNSEGWSSTLIVLLFAVSAAAFVAFLAVERTAREPMLPLARFKRHAFTGVQLAAFAISASMFSLFLYLTLYLQNYLGLSPLQAGLRYLPVTIMAFLFGPITGALIPRVPARVLMSVGLGLVGIALLWMSDIPAGSSWTTLLGGFLVAGAGIGLGAPTLATSSRLHHSETWTRRSVPFRRRRGRPLTAPPDRLERRAHSRRGRRYRRRLARPLARPRPRDRTRAPGQAARARSRDGRRQGVPVGTSAVTDRAHAKALCPVIARPTISVFTSRVPS
jgi:EmrB/QacA subfamily drug resistance transporter